MAEQGFAQEVGSANRAGPNETMLPGQTHMQGLRQRTPGNSHLLAADIRVHILVAQHGNKSNPEKHLLLERLMADGLIR